MDRHRAILLVGPTGSGKTPLGERLEEHGFWGRPCAHFDFGRELRRVAAGCDPDAPFTAEEVAFLRDVLRRGALLEDRHFPLARRILARYTETHRSLLAGGGLLVLNGIPRHVGQARDIDALADVALVVHLVCPPDAVHERIQTDVGGDRAGRDDDHHESVRRKQQLFEERTLPLLDYYRWLGAILIEIPVGAGTAAGHALEQLEALAPR